MDSTLPVSFHAVYSSSIHEALLFAHQNGFAGIQLAIESPHFDFHTISQSPTKMTKIRTYCQKNSLYVTLHAPDDVTSLFTIHPALKEGIFQYYKSLFDFAEAIGSPLVTIHLGQMTTFPTDSLPSEKGTLRKYPPHDLPLYREALKDNLTHLVEMVQDRFTLCVENYYLNTEILSVLESFLRENKIGLCWDYPKTFSRSGEKNQELFSFFTSHLPQIKQVHLHDLSTSGSGHRSIGSGILDLDPFFKLLKSIDVLDYCIEVRPEKQALASLQYLQRNRLV
ncbi:MAG: sugar phosphate isomerase/epimerase family protein [Promethearchaeota archaeon]